jgi:branched-chain amino acid transport system permease protein
MHPETSHPTRKLFLPLCGGVFFLILCFIPYVLPSYYRFLITLALIYGLFAMSYDIVLGYTGLVSVCHAIPFGVAAYGTLLASQRLGANLWIGALLGVGLSVAAGWIVGFFSTRSRGAGFIIMTVIFTLVLYTITLTWTSFTGGENGLMLKTRTADIIPGLITLSFKVGSLSLYYFTLVILALSYLICRRIISSPFGMILQAIKGNEVRAKAIGYNVERYKILSNIIAGIFASIAGILFLFANCFISADVVGIHPSVEVIIWSLLGGIGSLVGPMFGAIFMTFLTDYLRKLTENYLIILGALFFFAVLFFPDGIAGFVKERMKEL